MSVSFQSGNSSFGGVIDSPWYQSTPRIAQGMIGAIMPLNSTVGLC